LATHNPARTILLCHLERKLERKIKHSRTRKNFLLPSQDIQEQ